MTLVFYIKVFIHIVVTVCQTALPLIPFFLLSDPPLHKGDKVSSPSCNNAVLHVWHYLIMVNPPTHSLYCSWATIQPPHLVRSTVPRPRLFSAKFLLTTCGGRGHIHVYIVCFHCSDASPQRVAWTPSKCSDITAILNRGWQRPPITDSSLRGHTAVHTHFKLSLSSFTPFIT